MRILALTRYQPLGSSSRVRFYQYFPYLKSNNVDIVNAPFFTDDYVRDLYKGHRKSAGRVIQAYLKRISVLLQRPYFDLLWVEKEFLPWFPFGIEALLKANGIPYVVDYDDAVFHRYDMHDNIFIKNLLQHKIDHTMHNATVVIAGNDYLAERAIKAGARQVEILPSVVDVNQYTLRQAEADNTFKIGWIGSPVTVPYLSLIHEAIDELRKESAVQLVLIGAGKGLPLPDVPTEAYPWSEEIEVTLSGKFDVGLMPLIDGPFERGKCGYKLIQYMAGGLPVVASPVGVNQQIVEPSINGYLATTTDDWIFALRTLRDDLPARKAMGRAGREKAEKFYNLTVTAPRLLNLLFKAAKQ